MRGALNLGDSMLAHRSWQSGAFAAFVGFLLLATQAVGAERSRTGTRSRRTIDVVARQDVRRQQTESRQQALAGGGPRTDALIGLIQGTVAPDTWGPPAAPAPTNGTAGGPSPAALQLVEIIQTNVHPFTWDVNGGSGTIMLVPW